MAMDLDLAKVGYAAFRCACWPFCHITACEKLPDMAVFTKIESCFDAHVRPAFATWASKSQCNAKRTKQPSGKRRGGCVGWQSALQILLAMQEKRFAGLAETQRLTALRALAALALIGSAVVWRRLWPCVLGHKANRLNGGFGRMH